MGKKLIIKGADFSNVAVSASIDLTNRFVFVDSRGFKVTNDETLYTSSSVFKSTDSVDLSQYVGRRLYITIPVYRSAATNGRAEYGTAMVDANGIPDPVANNQQMELTPEGAAHTVRTYCLEITAARPYCRATFFMDSVAATLGVTFKAYVI